MLNSFADILCQHATQQPNRTALTLPAAGDAPEVNLTFGELALRSGAAVVPMMNSFGPNGQVRVVFHPSLDPGAADRPHAERVAGLVRQYAAFLESILQSEPENVSLGTLSRYLNLPLSIEPDHNEEAAAVDRTR